MLNLSDKKNGENMQEDIFYSKDKFYSNYYKIPFCLDSNCFYKNI